MEAAIEPISTWPGPKLLYDVIWLAQYYDVTQQAPWQPPYGVRTGYKNAHNFGHWNYFLYALNINSKIIPNIISKLSICLPCIVVRVNNVCVYVGGGGYVTEATCTVYLYNTTRLSKVGE